jgi:hypothetical protein
MASSSLLLISADGHVGPPSEKYKRYLDPGVDDELDAFGSGHLSGPLSEASRSFAASQRIASVRVLAWPAALEALTSVPVRPLCVVTREG